MVVQSLIRFAAALVLVLSLGLHWAFLQTIAWTGMVVSYSRDASLNEAVAKTFDGKHPCRMCKAIKQARAEEKKQGEQQVKPGSKLDSGLVWKSPALYFASDRERISSPQTIVLIRSYEPPKPRPRTA